MKNFYSNLKSIIIGLVCFLPILGGAQLNVNSAVSATDLANAIVGSGVSVSNVTLHCDDDAYGIFSNGSSTNIGLNEGILLTSGRASDAIGPNDNGGLSHNNSGAYDGDGDLDNLVSGSIQDACRLEFDFVAESDFITVQYVFGSEEYNEYVCSAFNDVFAFFVSGPNPAGGSYTNDNVALIPSTSLPVAVNTVNNGTPGSNGNISNCVSLDYNEFYVNNPNGSPTIQYDGFTVVLTAEVAVTPGETYHFKFAIADVSDSQLDSGVFIRSQSFSIYNCQAGILEFEGNLPAQFCSNDDIADLVSIASNSTATGDTYVFLLTNPAGEILEINSTGDFDLSGYAAGAYFVFGLSYDGEVSGIEVGNQLNEISVAEDEGCFDISAPLTIILEECISFELVACAPEITVECGTDLTDLELLGMPQVVVEAGDEAELSVTYSDETINGTDCGYTVIRTWVITLGDISEICTQVITVVDTQGPVFGDLEDVYVQCVEDVDFSDVTAIDACSGEAEVETFESQTGELVSHCCLSTAFGPGADWSVWLPVLTQGSCCINGANWNFDGCGYLDTYADGTAHIYGTVVNSNNVNQKFDVSMWLENKADWATWSGLGRNYKNDLALACATTNHTNWNFYELVGGFSTLTGQGDLAGDVLYLYHMPADYYFGFQMGTGANNKNCNFGISGWFTYDGFVDGAEVSGHGDLNTNASCEDGGNNDDCANSSSFTHLFRAEDACGHATIASQNVIVNDTTAPTFDNCPESLTIECSDEIPALAEGITATDNCIGDVEVTYLGETSEGNVCETIITRVWAAIDACGNRADCIQTITILDTTAPVFNGLPEGEITVECDAVPAAAEVTATDNCDDEVSVSFEETISEGTCYYNIYRSWYVQDECGNYNQFWQTIHVQDTTAPVFDAFEMYTYMECDEVADTLTATDNCGSVTIELTLTEYLSGGCLGVLHRVFVATDNCGNTATAQQYTSILDTTAPELVGVPEDATLECSEVSVGDDGNYFDDGGVYGVDNCGYHYHNNCLLPVIVTYSEEVVETDDDCPQSYDIIRTWVAVDYCENDTMDSQVVHVVDTEAPSLYIPYSYEAACDATLWFSDASAEDNCGIATITEVRDTIEGNCPNNYVITRTFVATDECGNASEPQTQTITVSDWSAPVFNEQPSSYTYECDETIEVIQPVATDNCSDLIEYSYSDTAHWGNTCYGGFYRVWTATDECGNSSVFYQSIYVQDTTAPVISGAPETSRPCDDYQGIFVTSVDNCNADTIFYWDEFVSGSCAGNVIRHYTAYDICQNASDEFIQVIHLTDAVAPVIESETEDFSVECGNEYGVQAPSFSDNCDDELDIVPGFNSDFDGCTTIETYTWTATDHCGNETTSTTVVTIVDTTNPWFENFPQDETVSCEYELPAVVYPSAYDNCDDNVDIFLAVEEAPGQCPQERFIYRTFRGVDNCGNQVVETQTIHVIDETAPAFNFDQQYYYVYECDETIEVIQPSAWDNCGEIEYAYNDTAAWSDGCYSGFTRIWTATDECGNSSYFYQWINVQDTTAPVVNPFDIEVSMPCDNVSDAILITATDNCNEAIITYDDEHVSGGCAGKIIRTYTIHDNCGNYTEGLYQQIISLIDTVAPVNNNTPENLVVECGDQYPGFDPNWSDNCDDELEVSAISGIAYDGCNQIISQVYFAIDNCGNESSVSRTITIVDTTNPELSNLPEDQYLDCEDFIAVAQVTAYDVCDQDIDVTHSDVIIPGECPATYTIERTFRAADLCGNEAVYTQHIYVSDTTAPYFTFVPEGGNYTCEEGAPSVEAEAADNCSTFDLSHSDVVIDTTIVIDFAAVQVSFCGHLITRTWVAIDACGNESSATTEYFVYDNVAPTFDQELENVYVQCVSDIPAPAEVTATDNCTEATVTVDTDVIEEGECGVEAVGVYYTAVDECGNTSYASYVIYVNDDIEPVLDGCPSDLVLACDAEIPSPADVTATDNCTENIEVSFDEYILGELPAEGSVADCDLITPARPANNPCVYPYDWAMAMFGLPEAHRWYYVSEGSLVEYPDGSRHLTAVMNNVIAPSNGWLVDVWFSSAMDWSDWSSQSFPTSFKADCGGEGANHEEWLYMLLQAGNGAELVGFGGYTGSVLNLVHAPENHYFGFQEGDGANNYNGAENGFGGWFHFDGIFHPGYDTQSQVVSGAGDFAFELDCCPDYWIVRQWTATDCSGNTTSCTQTISFEGTDITPSPVAPVLADNATKAESAIAVSPNPANDKTMFTFTAINAEKTTLEVFDMTGSKVADVFMGVVEAGIEYRVDYNVSKLATGIYTYRLTNGTDVQIGKLMINK